MAEDGSGAGSDPDFLRLLSESPDAEPTQSPFEELRRTRRQIENILQIVLGDDGVIVQDFTGRIIYANQPAARMLGAERASQLIRTPVERLLANLELTDSNGIPRPRELPGSAALRDGVTHEELLCLNPRSGRETWATVRVVPMRDHAGRIVAAATVLRDVTEQQRTADFREKVVGIVSHDLKSPLAAISLSLSLIERRPDAVDPKLAPLIARIRSSSERATRMVNDLLDLTQARLGGGMPIARQPVDIQALMEEVKREILDVHPGRTIRTEYQGERLARWDIDRMSQVLTNLLANALTYSPDDTPVRMAARGDHEAIAISVHNTGSPIPAEQIPHLFEPFVRAERGDSSRITHSVGLGLYIVKTIVEAHGGDLSVESSQATGTTFTARLPRDA